jgi:hypothetical protein
MTGRKRGAESLRSLALHEPESFTGTPRSGSVPDAFLARFRRGGPALKTMLIFGDGRGLGVHLIARHRPLRGALREVDPEFSWRG